MNINIKATVHRYNNAVKRKFNNKRVTLCREKDGSYYLEILAFGNNATRYSETMQDDNNNVVQMRVLRMSKEALEAFILNAVELLNIVEVTGGKPLSNHTGDLPESVVDTAGIERDEWTIF